MKQNRNSFISTKKVLIITGGSSGIGKAAAMEFVRNGFLVYELSRHGVSEAGVQHLTCDVTVPEQCHTAVEEVMRLEGQVDLLICNAGMGVAGSVEFASSEEMHRQLEVNFFGAVNMVQAVLPHMRAQQSGRILFVSSLAAVFSIPFQSFYSASKAALNGWAMSLRNEVAPYGIQVACLMPGDVRSGFTAARVKNELGTSVYPLQERAVQVMEHDEENGQSVQIIAHKLYQMATCRQLRALYYVGFSYRCLVLLWKLLPATWVNAILRRLYC